MKNLRQLTSKEVIFVGGETSNMYQHTGGLLLLDASDCPDFGFESYRRYVEASIARIPQFHWRLEEVALGLDLPYWVEDENFRIDHHVRRIAVPSPGDRVALGELVGYLYSKHMDRGRALWETWFIEGLADGRYALFFKAHHCLMDGQGAARLIDYLFEEKPGAAPKEIAPDLAEARAGEIPETWRKSLTAAWRLSRLPARATLELNEIFLQQLWKRVKHRGRRSERPPVPHTLFNTNVGSERGLVYGSLPLADIKSVKNHFDATVNDVVLALVGGMLRDYLLEKGALPEDSLRSFIAVSLRTEKDEEFSNKVTTAAVTLATDLDDPGQRLKVIAQESESAKQEAHGSRHKGSMEIQQMLPPVLNTALFYLAPPDKTASLAGANLLVSNVRTSPRKMFLAGARIDAIYPMSIVGPGLGINVTCVGYSDAIHFGITVDPRLTPDGWKIMDGLHEQLARYVALTGRKAPRRKRAATRAKKAPVKHAPGKKRP
jgi:WS/DGAT/MGAT family acyltransferase